MFLFKILLLKNVRLAEKETKKKVIWKGPLKAARGSGRGPCSPCPRDGPDPKHQSLHLTLQKLHVQ